ncbi:unnamed protein product [Prunus brigantina]
MLLQLFNLALVRIVVLLSPIIEVEANHIFILRILIFAPILLVIFAQILVVFFPLLDPVVILEVSLVAHLLVVLLVISLWMNHSYQGRIPTARLVAMAAVHSTSLKNNDWLADTDATSHVTPDLGALHTHSTYTGGEQIHIGDGQACVNIADPPSPPPTFHPPPPTSSSSSSPPPPPPPPPPNPPPPPHSPPPSPSPSPPQPPINTHPMQTWAKSVADTVTFILVYVDDILITGSSSAVCKQLIGELSALFLVKDLSTLHYFLGLEAHRDASGLFLSQTKYIFDLLQKIAMVGAKPYSSPTSAVRLDATSGEPLSNPTEFRALVGALQYLTWTRPDISFSVS